jgi:hypothetical protein
MPLPITTASGAIAPAYTAEPGRKISAGGLPYLPLDMDAPYRMHRCENRRESHFRYRSAPLLPSNSDGAAMHRHLMQRCVRSGSFAGLNNCHPSATKDQLDREDQLFQLIACVRPCVRAVDTGDARFQQALRIAGDAAAAREPEAANIGESFHAVVTADLVQETAYYRERYTPRRRSVQADAMQAVRTAEIKKEMGPLILERMLWERNQFFNTSPYHVYRAVDGPTLGIYIRDNRIRDTRVDKKLGISRNLNGTYFSMEYADDLPSQWDRSQMPRAQIAEPRRMFLLRVPIRHLLVKGFPKDHWNTGGCAEPLALSLPEHGEGGAIQCLSSTRDFKPEYIWKTSEGLHWVDAGDALRTEIMALHGGVHNRAG